jgi:hypothetical protein
MEFVIWVETRVADRTADIRHVATVDRPPGIKAPEEIGLSIADGKVVIRDIQRCIVEMQFEVERKLGRLCPNCQSLQRVKDSRPRSFRTVFGVVKVASCRYLRCGCRGGGGQIVSPLWFLRHRRTTPELEFLLASWGSRMPYRRAAELLGELLPLQDGPVAQSSVRRHTLAVGQLLDERVTVPDEYDFPDVRRAPITPRKRLTIAIDGTYVRSDRLAGMTQHYVVAGRVEADGHLGGSFAWVAQSADDARRFIRSTLETHGWTPTSRVVVLADGADGLASLIQGVTENSACEILDWFHISMRLRAIEQMTVKTAAAVEALDPGLAEMIRQKLPRVRHQMWNGQWANAIARMRAIFTSGGKILRVLSATSEERFKRFRNHLLDLRNYLISNQGGLTNYAHAYRHGLRISSAPAESGMNHLVNQRMGKHQPMRWSAEGAHLLLQVRCAMMDRRLDALFKERYPMFAALAPAMSAAPRYDSSPHL